MFLNHYLHNLWSTRSIFKKGALYNLHAWKELRIVFSSSTWSPFLKNRFKKVVDKSQTIYRLLNFISQQFELCKIQQKLVLL